MTHSAQHIPSSINIRLLVAGDDDVVPLRLHQEFHQGLVQRNGPFEALIIDGTEHA